MLILAIESSCDETSAAVVRGEEENGTHRLTVLSNEVASQIATHRLYGGVVPEIASRAHTEAVSSLTYDALEHAGITPRQLDAVAVTSHPGLIGALLVGVNFAKGFAYSSSLPLISVNHVRGHIAANYLVSEGKPASELRPPYLALAVSGGHTSLMKVASYTDFETIGRTRDDAAGEAFDKVARLLGIGYPGGKELDELASKGDPKAIRFPSAAVAGDNLDFSFSGPKTAVINYLNRASQLGEEISREDVAASFTAAAVSSLIKKLGEAIDLCGPEIGAVAVSGGVAANSHLRAALKRLTEKKKLPLFIPPLSLCGDNAAMIGAQCYFEFLAGNRAGLTLNAAATGEVDDSRRFSVEELHSKSR